MLQRSPDKDVGLSPRDWDKFRGKMSTPLSIEKSTLASGSRVFVCTAGL